MLSREEILTADDLPVLKVPTPEWGDKSFVFVRTLTAAEREEMRHFGTDKDGKQIPNYLGRFIAAVLCDSKGNRIFEDSDAEELGGKNPTVMLRVNDAAQTHNKMGDEEGDETEKNSETSQD